MTATSAGRNGDFNREIATGISGDGGQGNRGRGIGDGHSGIRLKTLAGNSKLHADIARSGGTCRLADGGISGRRKISTGSAGVIADLHRVGASETSRYRKSCGKAAGGTG